MTRSGTKPSPAPACRIPTAAELAKDFAYAADTLDRLGATLDAGLIGVDNLRAVLHSTGFGVRAAQSRGLILGLREVASDLDPGGPHGGDTAADGGDAGQDVYDTVRRFLDEIEGQSLGADDLTFMAVESLAEVDGTDATPDGAERASALCARGAGAMIAAAILYRFHAEGSAPGGAGTGSPKGGE
jgi:hypothetical protein